MLNSVNNLINYLTKPDAISLGLDYAAAIEAIVAEEYEIFKTECINKHLKQMHEYIEKGLIFKAIKHKETDSVLVKLQLKSADFAKIEEGKLDRFSMINNDNSLYGELVTEYIAEDGDRPDVIVHMPRPFNTDIFKDCQYINVYPILQLAMEDHGAKDYKIIGIPVDLIMNTHFSEIFLLNFVYFISCIILKYAFMKGRPNEKSVTKVTHIIGYQETKKFINSIRAK
jgi:inorganic pyrophosphatase